MNEFLSRFEQKISARLEDIKLKNRYRKLKSPSGIDLSSNDYLGISDNQEILSAFREGLTKYNCGSTSSRLIRGHRDVFENLEDSFSKWVNSESSLFLGNGFLANLGLLDLLGDSDSIFFLDRLCHASLLDGARLSGCETRYFKHMDYESLESMLKNKTLSKHPIVVTESIFSMDGDLVSIPELIQLKNKYGFTLVLDEAHALGLFGRQGSGITNSYDENFSEYVDFRIFTAGKSLGLEGAFISCKNKFKDYLVNTLRTFIFSTAPMPAIAFALIESINLVKKMDETRRTIFENSIYFRDQLKKFNFDYGSSQSHIIPIIQNNEKITMELAEALQSHGYDVRGIRPPTVKQSRLRININPKIDKLILDEVINILLTQLQ